MGKFIDLTGQRFGRLVVLNLDYIKKIKGGSKVYWHCQCDCGNVKSVFGTNLKKGSTKSCGCLRIENLYKKGCKTIDLTGRIFGRLKVIELVEKPLNIKGRSSYWKCQCECGSHVVVKSNSLIGNNTKSCGCFQKEIIRNAVILPQGIASLNKLYSTYENNAKKRNLVFNISIKDFKNTSSQKCFYCNVEPYQIMKNKNLNGDYVYNGIDRVDNSKGYTLDNIVPCCGLCNRAKSSMKKEEFLSWIERVYKHSVKNKSEIKGES